MHQCIQLMDPTKSRATCAKAVHVFANQTTLKWTERSIVDARPAFHSLVYELNNFRGVVIVWLFAENV